MKLHLFGDSVFQGAVTDIFDNRAESLKPLQTPAAIMDLALGRPFAALAGQTLFPHSVARAARELEAKIEAGQIAPGDAIALLDVGPHSMDVERHEADWRLLRRAAVGQHDVRLLMCSGFDNGAGGLRHLLHEAPIDQRSPNDAVRAAALAPGDFVGRTSYLDVAGPLKRLDEVMQRRFRRSVYLTDGVHLTAWGQIFLSLLILRALGVAVERPRALVDAVAANWRALGAPTPLRALVILKTLFEAAGVRDPQLSRRVVQVRLGRMLSGALRPFSHAPAEAQALAAALDEALAQGERLHGEGDAEGALAQFTRAAELNGASVRAQQGRLRAAVLADRKDEIVAAGCALLVLEPSSGKAYVWVAEAMIAVGPDPVLVAWLDDLAERHAPRRAAHALADLYRALGDDERAALWTERAAGRPRTKPVSAPPA